MYRKKILHVGILGLLAVGVSACGQNTVSLNPESFTYSAVELTRDVVSEDAASSEYDEDFISGTQQFSVELFKRCVGSQSSNQNLMISPTSVQTALAIAANGADGGTLEGLQKLLCSSDAQPEGISIDTLNQNLRLFAHQLLEEENVNINNGNSIWIRDEKDRISIDTDFLKRIKIFDAKAFLAPFDESTINDINNWVNEETYGMIPSLLSEIPEDAVIYILNAIAFDGKWQEPFTENDVNDEFVFVMADGTEQIVTGMSGEENIYLEDDNATGFVKYYEGQRYGFAALLPKEGMDVSEYIETLTVQGFQALFENKSDCPVRITMPKFRSEYTQNLNDILCDMGIADAFLDGADFSRMADTKTGILKIGNVMHKTFIELDEEGTKAAAVTMIEMTDGAAMPQEYKYVCLNRPFIYAIMDMDTKLPIFIGVLNTVE